MSIAAISAGYYGPGGRVILFVVTLIVILTVLVTFFRWIDYLSNLGRLSVTTDMVEEAAEAAMRARWEDPHMACAAFESVPAGSFPVFGNRLGYIQHLDVARLSEIAAKAAGRVYVTRLPGTFGEPTSALLWASWQPAEEEQKEMRKAFAIEATRTFDQDPRFGLIVLSEIASRALSPGINDPGTAIEIIGRIVRILSIWAQDCDESADETRYPDVYIPRLEIDDMFADAFDPIARDGADTFEVGIRLRKAFGMLYRLNPARFGECARRHSKLALELSLEALKLDEQKQVLKDLAAQIGEPHPDQPVFSSKMAGKPT